MTVVSISLPLRRPKCRAIEAEIAGWEGGGVCDGDDLYASELRWLSGWLANWLCWLFGWLAGSAGAEATETTYTPPRLYTSRYIRISNYDFPLFVCVFGILLGGKKTSTTNAPSTPKIFEKSTSTLPKIHAKTSQNRAQDAPKSRFGGGPLKIRF